jgi:aldehyde dehydrogenase (NAD+)
VDVILFTGSYEVGSMIRQEAARDYKKFAVTEMGGKNALLILHDADLDLAVNAALLSAFKPSGQRCTAASRIIVQESIFDRFADALETIPKR